MLHTSAAHHSINRFQDVAKNRTEVILDKDFLKGTTIWINEHMAVGHMMYDVYLIQLLQVIPVDRIVHQRAPCVNMNLCDGTGSWDGWYMGYFAAIFDAFQPGVPVYVRWTWQDKNAKPLFPSGSEKGGYISKPSRDYYPSITLNNAKCFERVVKRKCQLCYQHGIGLRAVRQFKAAAYNLIKTKPPVGPYFDSDGPIVVTFSYRGIKASRHIENVDFVISKLGQYLPSPAYQLNIFPSTNNTIMYDFQIELVARSHIVISEHGAFESNLIYMKRGSYFIELRGDYKHNEFENFHKLATMFEVFYDFVTTSGLKSHHDDALNITSSECLEVVEKIRYYVDQAPYKLADKLDNN